MEILWFNTKDFKLAIPSNLPRSDKHAFLALCQWVKFCSKSKFWNIPVTGYTVFQLTVSDLYPLLQSLKIQTNTFLCDPRSSITFFIWLCISKFIVLVWAFFSKGLVFKWTILETGQHTSMSLFIRFEFFLEIITVSRKYQQ